uniref:Uncharacterized protein n=1 Tax=Pristionchus pacificus TaxID=54126 RepID=A0A2A6BVP3_PRIPA|eukprot:PDM69938.1 hypothetical protein PRIPAC_49150 [Pristionchus pacificus]
MREPNAVIKLTTRCELVWSASFESERINFTAPEEESQRRMRNMKNANHVSSNSDGTCTRIVNPKKEHGTVNVKAKRGSSFS